MRLGRGGMDSGEVGVRTIHILILSIAICTQNFFSTAQVNRARPLAQVNRAHPGVPGFPIPMANQTQSMDCPVINERVLALRGTAAPPPKYPLQWRTELDRWITHLPNGGGLNSVQHPNRPPL